MMDSSKKEAQARREAVKAMLPASINKLPWFEYRQRAAETSEEYLSEVEFGVDEPGELHRRFSKRYRAKK